MRATEKGNAMTFDDLWPTLVIPGEFDAMDDCDQRRWRGVLQQAFDAGIADERERCAVIAETLKVNEQWASGAWIALVIRGA